MFPGGRPLAFVIVGGVALIVVGLKDLPILMRKVGQFMARVRGMAAEFRASFDELARQSELEELRKEEEALRIARPVDLARSASAWPACAVCPRGPAPASTTPPASRSWKNCARRWRRCASPGRWIS